MSGLKRGYADMREKILANVAVDEETGCWNWQRSITKSTLLGMIAGCFSITPYRSLKSV